MISFLDLLVVIGMFALRIGVPLAITIGLVYLLKRLDARWEAEARAERAKAAELAEAVQPAERPVVPQPGRAPVAPKRAPTPQLPFIPPIVPEPIRPQPGLAMAPAPQPCWDIKGCSESAKAQCAAPQRPGVPCWQARFDAEGKIPDECVSCDIFQRYPRM